MYRHHLSCDFGALGWLSKGEALIENIWATSCYHPSPSAVADLNCRRVAGLATEVN